jgi:hypothetical protein
MDWQKIKNKAKKPLKIIGYIVLVWIILSVIAASYFGIKALQDKSQKDKVEIKVMYDIENCTEEHPLIVVIKNDSNRTINSVDFDIEIRRKGHSDNIASYLSYETDKIIDPEKVHISCWRYDLKYGYEQYNNPENLEFSIDEYKYIKFKE